jgi:hypothetical protein
MSQKREQRATSGDESQTESSGRPIQDSRFFVTKLSDVNLIQNVEGELAEIQVSSARC